MADNESKEDKRDRPVAGDEVYGTRYLSERPNTTTDQVRELIKRHGSDRETLMQDARKLA